MQTPPIKDGRGIIACESKIKVLTRRSQLGKGWGKAKCRTPKQTLVHETDWKVPLPSPGFPFAFNWGRGQEKQKCTTLKLLFLNKRLLMKQTEKNHSLRIKLWTTSVCPISHARKRGVCCNLSTALTQAPNSTSSSTQSTRPEYAAAWSAVPSVLSFVCTSSSWSSIVSNAISLPERKITTLVVQTSGCVLPCSMNLKVKLLKRISAFTKQL